MTGSVCPVREKGAESGFPAKCIHPIEVAAQGGTCGRREHGDVTGQRGVGSQHRVKLDVVNVEDARCTGTFNTDRQ